MFDLFPFTKAATWCANALCGSEVGEQAHSPTSTTLAGSSTLVAADSAHQKLARLAASNPLWQARTGPAADFESFADYRSDALRSAQTAWLCAARRRSLAPRR